MNCELTQEGIRFYGVSNLDAEALDNSRELGEKILNDLGLMSTGFSGDQDSCLVRADELNNLDFEAFEELEERFQQIINGVNR